MAWNKFRSLWAVTSFHGSWSWRWMESSMVLVWTVDKGPHDDSVHPTATPWEWDTGGATAMLCVPCLLPELLDKHGAWCQKEMGSDVGLLGPWPLGAKKSCQFFYL